MPASSVHHVRAMDVSLFSLRSILWPEPLLPTADLTCSSVFPDLWDSSRLVLLVKTDAKKVFSTSSLFYILWNEVPCLTEQWAYLFLSLPFIISVLTKALVVFDIFGWIQLYLGFNFPNFIPGWMDKDSVLDKDSIWPSGYQFLLPPFVGFILISEFGHELLVHPCWSFDIFTWLLVCWYWWSSLDLGRNDPWIRTISLRPSFFPGHHPIFKNAKVCSPEFWGFELSFHSPPYPQDPELYWKIDNFLSKLLMLHLKFIFFSPCQ